MPSKKIPTLAARLMALETDGGMTRVEVAEAIGISRVAVLNLHRGAIPRAVTLGRVAVVLDCSTDELLAEWVPELKRMIA